VFNQDPTPAVAHAQKAHQKCRTGIQVNGHKPQGNQPQFWITQHGLNTEFCLISNSPESNDSFGTAHQSKCAQMSLSLFRLD